MNGFLQDTSNQEQAIKSFLQDFSNKPKDGQTIKGMLSEACRFYDADRSYIFELNSERTYIRNTYEWCREGVSAEMGNLQNISLEGIEFWLEELEENGELFIPSLSESFPPDSCFFKLLAPQGVESIAAVPLIVNGSTVGFLGVNDPCSPLRKTVRGKIQRSYSDFVILPTKRKGLNHRIILFRLCQWRLRMFTL